MTIICTWYPPNNQSETVSLSQNSFLVNHHNALNFLLSAVFLYPSTEHPTPLSLLMSPARSKSPGSQQKPYARGMTPIMTPSVLQDSNTSRNDEHAGFPTYAQYKQVENGYIQSLTPRRQAKALISQSMFDRIWDVLHQPDCQGETAQFRFWARKMFTVSKNHRNTLGADTNNDEVQEVLLHDNLLVAVQEQLYDLLCYCHGSTGHGGRDKTCAMIRKHYTWVPKDLVSSFIKACPTCIWKKCSSLTSSIVAQSTYDIRIEDMNLPTFREFNQSVCSQDQAVAASSSTMPGIEWPSMRNCGDIAAGPILLEDDPLEAAYREAILRAKDVKARADTTQRVLQSFPMSREVSLYKGLPNGWQFRHSDYASAHAEFMQTRHLPVQDSDSRYPRPRVPSIAPLWGPNDYPQPESDNLNDVESTQTNILPLGGPDHNTYPPMTLQYILLGSNQRLGGEEESEITHQIDPSLMVSAATTYDESGDRSIIAGVPVGADSTSGSSHPSSSSIKRAAAPPRLHLDTFPTEKSFQALLAYRESLGEGNTNLESPMMHWHPGNPSPASSFGSCVSRLSYTASPTSSLSPPTTALPTPVDEYDAGNFMKGKGKLSQPEAMDMELSSSVDVVHGL